MPAKSNPSPISRFKRLGPAGQLGLVVGCAFAAGFLVFVLTVMGRSDEAREDIGTPASIAPVVVSSGLPVPEASGPDSASGIEIPDETMLQEIAQQQSAALAAQQPDLEPDWSEAEPETGAVVQAADSPARVTHAPSPGYPAAAMRRRESGEVMLRLHVGSNGRLRGVEILRSSGFRSLDRAATQAVRRWSFEPAMRNGAAVDGILQIPIQFTL